MALIDAVIAYDVRDDDVRARLAALLSRRGVRLQKSVFAIRVEATDLDATLDQIRSLIDLDHDVVHLFRQCGACDADAVSLGQVPPDLHIECWIV